MEFSESKTFKNLKNSFINESESHMRYHYFATKADQENLLKAAEVFLRNADGEVGQALSIMELLEESGDPLTGQVIGTTKENIKAAIDGEVNDFADLYPGYAKMAREEGYEDIGELFETLAKSQKSHINRLREVRYFK